MIQKLIICEENWKKEYMYSEALYKNSQRDVLMVKTQIETV